MKNIMDKKMRLLEYERSKENDSTSFFIVFVFFFFFGNYGRFQLLRETKNKTVNEDDKIDDEAYFEDKNNGFIFV